MKIFKPTANKDPKRQSNTESLDLTKCNDQKFADVKSRQNCFHCLGIFFCFFKIPHDTVERASDLHVKATKKYTGFDAAA